jgi:hydrogenase nickel incorporation protein HypA/HybF
MHEMSLCEGILDILQTQAAAQHYARVRKVTLEIGPLAGVEVEALRFAFDVVAEGTLAEAAELEILPTAARAWCFDCAANVAISQRYDPCPRCEGHQWQMVSGDEMRIKELEVE